MPGLAGILDAIYYRSHVLSVRKLGHKLNSHTVRTSVQVAWFQMFSDLISCILKLNPLSLWLYSRTIYNLASFLKQQRPWPIFFFFLFLFYSSKYSLKDGIETSPHSISSSCQSSEKNSELLSTWVKPSCLEVKRFLLS